MKRLLCMALLVAVAVAVSAQATKTDAGVARTEEFRKAILGKWMGASLLSEFSLEFYGDGRLVLTNSGYITLMKYRLAPAQDVFVAVATPLDFYGAVDREQAPKEEIRLYLELINPRSLYVAEESGIKDPESGPQPMIFSRVY